MKRHSVLWYLIVDWLADLRAFLAEIYGDYGQAIALIQAEAAATARANKVQQ